MFYTAASLLFIFTTSATLAFAPNSHILAVRNNALLSREMSSLPQENDKKHKDAIHKTFWKNWIPPPPEDQLVMTGDVVALFVYSFLDHTLNKLFVDYMNTPSAIAAEISTVRSGGTFDAIASSEALYSKAITSLPVWFDKLTSAPFGSIPLTSALPMHQVAYAPAISTAGMASVLLTSAWLVCGYLTGAFLFRNTLQCNTRHAIQITAKTWLYTCGIMVAIALGSDGIMGGIDGLHFRSVGGLTKADADFIFDSLSVLVLWRFVLCSLLGHGGGGGGGSDNHENDYNGDIGQ